MITHGTSYQLMRDLNILDDKLSCVTDINSRLSAAQEIVLAHLRNAYNRNVTNYNLRSKPRVFQPGQPVFVRNYVQSNAGIHFSSKLAPKFIKGKVLERIGNVAYKIADSKGKLIGVYHGKDIR